MDFDNFDVFSDKAGVADADRVLLLDPDLLYPDPKNVRRDIDQATINELAATIEARGQLQAVTVAPKDDEGRYRIQFGERRWRACKQLGIKVRAIVAKTDDPAQVRVDQFIENDQRENLSTANVVAFVAEEVASGRTLADLARQTGRNRTLLTRYHGLASAPDYISALFGDVSMRSAVALTQAAKTDDAATRTFVADTATEDMTVLACERFAREIGAKKASARAPTLASVPDTAGVEQNGSDATSIDPAEKVDLVSPSTTNEIRDDEADRALAETPPVASTLNVAPIEQETTTRRSSPRSKPAKPKVERPTIEIEGKRAMVVEALLHFDGEEQPRILSWR